MIGSVMSYNKIVSLEIVILNYAKGGLENTSTDLPFAVGILLFLTSVAAQFTTPPRSLTPSPRKPSGDT